MERLSVQAPALYGDHHVTAVRALLLGMPGVGEVYASSAFQLIEVEFDEGVIGREAILARLASAGYLGEMDVPQESGRSTLTENKGSAFFRHSTAHANTGRAISFSQQVPSAGRSLWPCPGIGPLESRKEELENG
jgi:hypothetical protein